MAEWNVRPLVILVAVQVLLVAGLVVWAAVRASRCRRRSPGRRRTARRAPRPRRRRRRRRPRQPPRRAPRRPPPAPPAGRDGDRRRAAPPAGRPRPARDDQPLRRRARVRAAARAGARLRLAPRGLGEAAPARRAAARAAAQRALRDVPGHKGLRNVVGSLPGRGKAIVVGAHYDVEARPVGFVGANDGAAGTAAVVELARKLARAPRSATTAPLRFVLFDGEEEPAGCEIFLECALRGSKAYVKRHGEQTRNLVLLDYIAEKRDLSFPHEGGSDPAL